MILLQPFTREDLSRLVSWVDTPQALVQWAGNRFQFPFTEAQFEQHLLDSAGPDPSALIYKTICRDRLKVIGHIEIDRIDYIDKTAFLSRALVGDPTDRDRGYGTAMIQRVLDIAFRNLALRQLSLDVLIFNLPAIQCCQKNGFGVLRTQEQSVRLADKLWSSHHMVLESKEWLRQQQGIR